MARDETVLGDLGDSCAARRIGIERGERGTNPVKQRLAVAVGRGQSGVLVDLLQRRAERAQPFGCCVRSLGTGHV
ncbi:hypothetical protein, partial [Sinorhizobium medicae]|uniref:hypothetical protein n=1 Tax=Sinorhizobium medicae TaxID=110321 RepID=UPI001AEC7762